MNCSKPKRFTARSTRQEATAIILAASRGQGMDELTRDRPKVMIPVAGKTVLRRLVDKFKAQGVNDITVVGGYRSEAIDAQGVKLVVNEDWERGSELASLSCAIDALSDNTVLLYGDLLFRTYILNNLMDWEADLLVVVDSSPLEQAPGNKNDLAYCSAPDDRAMYQQKVSLERISSDPEWQGRPPDGRWIGMLRARGAGRRYLLEALEQLRQRPRFRNHGRARPGQPPGGERPRTAGAVHCRALDGHQQPRRPAAGWRFRPRAGLSRQVARRAE